MNNRSVLVHLSILLLAVLATGCSDGSDGDFSSISLAGCADTDSCVSNPPLVLGGERPSDVYIPSNYTPTTRYPLVISLHGFGANGIAEAYYMGLVDRVDPKQYILVTPDGTVNESGLRYWDGTDACCAGSNFGQVDDVAYIRKLIEEAAATYSIDPQRVALFGHSNGGFMSLRMACEASDIVTTVLSLAGATWDDSALCTPASYPLSALILHGTDDETILYDGGAIGDNAYPGAVTTSQRLAEQGNCDVNNTIDGPDLDVDASIPGLETTVLAYPDCARDTEVELWTIVGGPHIPLPWNPEAQDAFVDWLTGHPRR